MQLTVKFGDLVEFFIAGRNSKSDPIAIPSDHTIVVSSLDPTIAEPVGESSFPSPGTVEAVVPVRILTPGEVTFRARVVAPDGERLEDSSVLTIEEAPDGTALVTIVSGFRASTPPPPPPVES